MPFAAVAWAFKDVIASSKLAQMVENIVTHDHRADGTQGAAVPAGRATRSTAQSIPVSTWTAITFDTEDYDRGTLWVPGQPTRLVAPVTGVYHVSGAVSFAYEATANGVRAVELRVNGAAYSDHGLQRFAAPITRAGFATTVHVTDLVELAAGAYVELFAYQESGGSISTIASTELRPALAIALQSKS